MFYIEFWLGYIVNNCESSLDKYILKIHHYVLLIMLTLKA